ncbi:MAG: DMT family transporter [Burkholderiales bacterium]
MNSLYLALTILVGVALPFQVAMNGQVRVSLGHPMWGALTNFAIGLVALIIMAAIMRAPIPTTGMLTKVPVWAWWGGIIGQMYIVSAILAGPKLGSATFFAVIIAGQVLTSLILDHFGVLGFPHSPINLWKALGALLLIVGVVLVVKN